MVEKYLAAVEEQLEGGSPPLLSSLLQSSSSATSPAQQKKASEGTAAVEEDEKMEVTEAAECTDEGGVKAAEVENAATVVAATSESIKVEEECEEMVDVETLRHVLLQHRSCIRWYKSRCFVREKGRWRGSGRHRHETR